MCLGLLSLSLYIKNIIKSKKCRSDLSRKRNKFWNVVIMGCGYYDICSRLKKIIRALSQNDFYPDKTRNSLTVEMSSKNIRKVYSEKKKCAQVEKKIVSNYIIFNFFFLHTMTSGIQKTVYENNPIFHNFCCCIFVVKLT